MIKELINEASSDDSRKLGEDGADVKWHGSLFQEQAAATGKARSMTVDNCVQRTISDDDDDDAEQI